MKKIEAFIRAEQLQNIKDMLNSCNLNGMSISQVMGCGNQKGWREFVRGAEIDYNFLPKIKIELVVPDEQADELVNCMIDHVQTGEVGDGKIFISNIEDAVRIRTNERGISAIK